MVGSEMLENQKPLECVGWVERSDTHADRYRFLMGIAALNPSYLMI
jgi:hypothetical protein